MLTLKIVYKTQAFLKCCILLLLSLSSISFAANTGFVVGNPPHRPLVWLGPQVMEKQLSDMPPSQTT